MKHHALWPCAAAQFLTLHFPAFQSPSTMALHSTSVYCGPIGLCRLSCDRNEGFYVKPKLLDSVELDELRTAVAGGFTQSTRLALSNPVVHIYSSIVASRLESSLEWFKGNRCLSCHYFTKSETENWMVPFHRDEFFMVQSDVDLGEISDVCMKEGVQFGRFSATLLRRIVAVRVALDAIPANHGPLRVIPRSHVDDGRNDAHQDEMVVTQSAGDALLMSPMLLHASGKVDGPHVRRVLHYAYLMRDGACFG